MQRQGRGRPLLPTVLDTSVGSPVRVRVPFLHSCPSSSGGRTPRIHPTVRTFYVLGTDREGVQTWNESQLKEHIET